MRASRLVSLLLLLQTRGRMTAEQLAMELEVSVRTVYRDVEALSESGIPVYADRGAHGGFQLVEGYRTRLTGLTTEEAEALFLSGYPGPAAQLGLGTVLAAAQLKVLAALPPELRSRASRLRQRFHLDAPGWFQEPEAAPHLQPIAEAVWSDRRLRMRYRRGSDDMALVDRVVDPLGLVLKAGIWYLVGRVGESYRTYRVSRILELEALDGRFERPDGFDLAAYWDDAVTAYTRSLPTLDAVVRVTAEGLERLPMELASSGGAEVQATGEPDAAGWRTVHLRVEDVPHGVTQLLPLGSSVEVVDPPELRTAIAAEARRTAALYG